MVNPESQTGAAIFALFIGEFGLETLDGQRVFFLAAIFVLFFDFPLMYISRIWAKIRRQYAHQGRTDLFCSMTATIWRAAWKRGFG